MSKRALLCSIPVALSLACGDDGESRDSLTSTITVPTASDPSPTATGPDDPTGAAPTGGEGTAGATGTTTLEDPTVALTGGMTTTLTTTNPGETTATTDPIDPDTGESTSSTTEPIDLCKVQDEMDAMVPCTDEAPPNSFEPDIQWVWPGQDGDTQVAVTPVVANLTDDNGDGEIDLCDIPDIVVPVYPGRTGPRAACTCSTGRPGRSTTRWRTLGR
jgi:hypothetical protein